MQQLFQIRFIQWGAYVGFFLVGLIAVAVGLRLENIPENYPRLIIICFAAFVIFLFFIFLSILQKKWTMPKMPFTLLVGSHGILLLVGFGIIPVALFEQSLVDSQYMFIAPTGFFSLIIASATAFFCYWIFSGMLTMLCRYRGPALFLKAIETVRENKSLIICIGAIALLLAAVIGLQVGGEAVFFLELSVLPFATYVFAVFADPLFAVPTALLIGACAISYGLLVCKSMSRETTMKQKHFFQSIIFLSRHFFIANLILWAIYMKTFGIIFEIGSWNPFQII